jgi:hypothetical protein
MKSLGGLFDLRTTPTRASPDFRQDQDDIALKRKTFRRRYR